MIRWDEPGYVVGFTTRVGGVSGGPFASLNLARSSGDEVELVDENRRRACAELGAERDMLAMNRQVHSAAVHRAHPGTLGERGDGLWTDERGVPMLVVTADCVPIAIASTGGRRLALLHAGWRGLAEGVVAAGVRMARGDSPTAPLAAAVGPAIGPCCYEVGPEVAARFDPDLTVDRRLDLWTLAERRLREAGVARVERVDLCTSCHAELFFSHRRDGLLRGAQGAIGYVA